jgi:hypothetical protein
MLIVDGGADRGEGAAEQHDGSQPDEHAAGSVCQEQHSGDGRHLGEGEPHQGRSPADGGE